MRPTALGGTAGVSASSAMPRRAKRDGLGRDKRDARELLALPALARDGRVSGRASEAATVPSARATSWC